MFPVRGAKVLDGNILIADEQSLCREGLVALLNRTWSDATIEQADSFTGAMRALSGDDAIKVAIVDLNLPGLSEIAGIRHLRTRFPRVRIVVTAAVLRRDTVVDCLRAGVHGCIAKSLPATEIVEALDTIAKERIYVPSIVGEEMTSGGDLLASPNHLSGRQQEVLAILAIGKSNKEIARELGIAEGTVKVHVNAVYRALGVNNRVGAVAALRDIENGGGGFEPALPGLLHPNRQPASPLRIRPGRGRPSAD